MTDKIYQYQDKILFTKMADINTVYEAGKEYGFKAETRDEKNHSDIITFDLKMLKNCSDKDVVEAVKEILAIKKLQLGRLSEAEPYKYGAEFNRNPKYKYLYGKDPHTYEEEEYYF